MSHLPVVPLSGVNGLTAHKSDPSSNVAAPAASDRGNCEKPKSGPKLRAPVICAGGRVHPTEPRARKRCAPGCVPYLE